VKNNDARLLELGLYAFWHEDFKDEVLDSPVRMAAAFNMLRDNGGFMTAVEQPNMRFSVGARIAKRTCSAGMSLPNKKGVVIGFKKTLRRDGKPQWRYIVKLDNGKMEEWVPGVVYACEDPKADRVAFT
jgi:hypothetical protein